MKRFTLLTIAMLFAVVAFAQQSKQAFKPFTPAIAQKALVQSQGLTRTATTARKAPRRAGTVTPPEGAESVTYYTQGGTFLLYTGEWSNYTKNMESVEVIVDGSDIYIAGLAYYVKDSWIKGTLDGTTATFPSGQQVDDDAEYPEWILGTDDGSTISKNIVFTFDQEAGTLTAVTKYICEAGSQTSLSLYAYWESPSFSTEAPEAPEAVVLPEGVELVEYVLSYASTADGEATEGGVAGVAVDGNDVYFKGFSTYLPDALIKGTKDGNTVTFPVQYLGNYADMDDYLYKEAVFTYNPEDESYSAEGEVYSVLGDRYYDFHGFNPVLRKPVDQAVMPANPQITGLNNGSYGYYITFNVPNVDVNGEPLVSSKLSYEIFTDVERNVQPLTFTSATHEQLTEDMTVIPYAFTENWDFYTDQIYLNGLYSDSWNKIGIKSIYTGGDAVNETEIQWFDIKDYALNEGVYYVVNEATGKFLSRGDNWGTRAMVDDYGFPITVAMADGAGVFRLYSVDWGSGAVYGFDDDMYSDANGGNVRSYSVSKVANGLKLTNTSNGKLVYVNENNLVNGNGVEGDNFTDANAAVWQFISMDEYKELVAIRDAAAKTAVFQAAGVAEDAELTEGEPVELTFKTGSAWAYTAEANRNKSTATNEFGTELYEGSGKFTQAVEGLESGLYKVSVQGFFRDGWNENVSANYDLGYNLSNAYLQANDTKVPVKSWGADRASDSNPNSMAEAAALFDAGKYVAEGYAFVGEDGKLALDVVVPAYISGGWYIFSKVTYAKVNAAPNALISVNYNYESEAEVEAGSEVLATFEAEGLPEDLDPATLVVKFEGMYGKIDLQDESALEQEGSFSGEAKLGEPVKLDIELEGNYLYDIVVDPDATFLYDADGNTVGTFNLETSPELVLIVNPKVDPEYGNLDFEEGDPVAGENAGICTYAKDMETNGTTLSQMQPVKGWDMAVENGDARAAGLFTYGSGKWLGGSGYTVPETDPEGNPGQALGIVAVWTGTAQYSQPVTIPAGTYKITVPIYNAVGGTSPIVKNLTGFIADNGTEYLATSKTYPVNEWYTETINLVLTEETTGIFTVGYTADNAGSGSMPHLFLDKFVLEEAEAVALLRDELEKAINAAQTTVDAGKAAGDGLFGYNDESNDELDQAIVDAQNVNDDADATADELQAAIDAIKDATDKYKDSINKPGDEEYVITQKASGLYLSVATDLVTISAEPCKLKFEETEGGWFITNGTNYVGCVDGSAWNMTAVGTPTVATVTNLGNGEYTIEMAGHRSIGTDGTEDGAYCYADKYIGRPNYDETKCIWAIQLADVVGINEINAAAIKPEGVYTVNGMKVNVDARLPKGIYIIDGKKVVIK